MSTKKYPECHSEIEEFNFCPHCGAGITKVALEATVVNIPIPRTERGSSNARKLANVRVPGVRVDVAGHTVHIENPHASFQGQGLQTGFGTHFHQMAVSGGVKAVSRLDIVEAYLNTTRIPVE